MKWDYIIIGAGSAGCTLAQELVKSGRHESILVLEAGGSDRSPFIKIPAGVLRACEKYNWGYRSQPDPSRNGASEDWLRGRVLGGSSSINGMVFIRGAAADFDRWAEHCGGIGGWSAQDVMRIFRELETSDQDGPLRGHAGPLHVTTVHYPHAVTKAFIESAVATGHPFNQDYNGRSQEGISYLQRSLRKGLRCSAADAFLKPILGGKNLKLLLNAFVERIEVTQGRATAVSFLHRGQRRREAARHIILCAGVINSPKLLMLSGIGDPAELERHRIDTLLELPGVGRHLKEQPSVRLVYRSRIPTYNLTEGLTQKLGLLAKFIRHREGPISSAFEATAFVKSTPSIALPDVQLLFFPLGYLVTERSKYTLTPYPAFTTYVMGSYPASSGRIRLASQDAAAPPLIECRLLEEQVDVDTLVRGVELVRKIMRTEPIANLVDAEVFPGAPGEGAEATREFVRRHTEISYHPIGSCRMGTGPDAVVGPDLRVRGIDNLWIADASIMPHHLSANINAACMMIGAKLGKQLAAR